MRNQRHHEGGRRGGPRNDDAASPDAELPRGSGRRRRGDVRAALLVALLDGPAHGYQLIQTLTERSGGGWRPSPGAVYPSLEALLDEGLVTATSADGRRIFALTEVGRSAAEERRAAGTPLDPADGPVEGRGRLRVEVYSLVAAAKQVGISGSPELVDQAVAIVTEARKGLYRLLAEA